LLHVDGLSAGYDGVQVLHEVSFTADMSEILAILGANGAGKSTLLRALSGLVPIYGGSIVFNGRDISGMAAADRVRLGLVHVPEGRQMLPGLTVHENLMLGAFVRRRDKPYVDRARARALELFPVLRERERQLAGSLSGGEQQMLAIARALMSGPKLLLLDEPSLGLAPLIVNRIFEVIQSLRQDGTPIVVVEQNAKKALEIADRAILLQRGRVSVAGGAADLLEHGEVHKAYLGGG
jgi:branched-chain amino acid transport system ATP-binding protein